MGWVSSVFSIKTSSGGTGGGRAISLNTNNTTFTVQDTGASGIFQFQRSTSATNLPIMVLSGTYTASSGVITSLQISPTINQSSTAGYTTLLVNPTETATGSGSKLLADFQVGGTSKFKVANDGLVTATNRITSVTDPTNAQDVATKNYVDTADTGKVAKTGDTMTGALTLQNASSSTSAGLSVNTTTGLVGDSQYAQFGGRVRVGYLGSAAAGASMIIDDVPGGTTTNKYILYGASGNYSLQTGTGTLYGTTLAGTTTPTHTITLASTATGIATYNTSDQTTNYERLRIYWSSNILNINTEQGGTGSLRQITINGASSFITLNGSNVSMGRGNTGNTNVVTHQATFTSSTIQQVLTNIAPTITQTGTAGYTTLLINPTETTTGSGTRLLADFQVGGATKTRIDNTGNHILSSGAGLYLYNTADETTNYERLRLNWSSNIITLAAVALARSGQ